MNTINQTILVIEESPTDDEAIRSILGMDHSLVFSSGNLDALEIDAYKSIDLVLLDINTPGVEVDEICSHLRDNPDNHNTPVILMVKKEQECQLESLPAGVSDCITKPLQPPIVMARVESHLKLKRYHDLWESPMMDSVRKLDSLLTREWQRALRNQTPISLVLIDIDFFKEYEVEKGQSAGDNSLSLVGEALRSCIKRDMDLIVSHDTHAFICLLPDTDLDGARRVCQQLLEKVAIMNIPHPCSPVSDRITISIGMSTARPSFNLGQDYLRYQAEISLEKAKECGHNQVKGG